MNKQEKLICFLLGLGLVWCFISGVKKVPAKPEGEAAPAAVETASEAAAAKPAEAATEPEAPAETEPAAKFSINSADSEVQEILRPDEEFIELENDELKLVLSTYGGVVKSATLKQYAVKVGELSEQNPALSFDFSESPLGAFVGVSAAHASYYPTNVTATSVTFVGNGISRTYTLGANYSLKLDETFAESARLDGSNGLSLGVMRRGSGENDLISVDHAVLDNDLKIGSVVHHDDDDSTLKPLLAGAGVAGGCGCNAAKSVEPGMPEVNEADVRGPIAWVALKDRFFVTAFAKTTQPVVGFRAEVFRDLNSSMYRPVAVAATAQFAGGVESRSTEFFIGPKQQSLLWDLGMKDVMEFGMWRWICYPVVKLLNICHAIIPSYGIAVILLTIIVRLLFWPLTRKSTEGMKKMQEIQPLVKELQAKFKDNPQRLQQETFALYREKKVNPLSSCLPMLIQIPIFIALFNVLRTAVELRYAGFLWIADLSEPEGLFASWFPIGGGLNILPLLMAVTMYLQSKLTPSAGDPNQQKMMTVMMPILMLFMFYKFAAALSLYWTLSQAISIVQMWLIRRQSAAKTKVWEPEVIDPPTPTRQQRRHS